MNPGVLSIIFFVFAIVLSVIGAVRQSKSEGWVKPSTAPWWFALFFALIGLGTLLGSINWQEGEQKLTGYIYAAEDGFGNKTTGYIRYSLNAGSDEQPHFCVLKEDGQMLKDLAGSGKQVEVITPAGITLAWTWDCAIPSTVNVIGE